VKQLVPWLKAHWPIPALTLVALAALPTAMYFAGKMQDDLHASFQKRVSDAATSVLPNSTNVKYGIPAMDGSGNVLEMSAPANEQMIAAYKKILEDMQAKVGIVSEKGLAFNQGDHKALVDGYFPNASPDGGRGFIKQYIDFHKKLVTDMRGGEPPKADDVAKALTDHRDAFVAKIRAERGTEPNAEDQATLAGELLQMRVGAIRKRAAQIGVYADPGVFDGVPVAVPEKAPTAGEAWDKQERAWVHQDLCRAILLANGGSGATGGVSGSVVKRLLRVNVAPPMWDVAGASAQAYEPGEEKAPLDFGVSLTGRHSGAGSKNKWYDVRTATIDVIVSSKNLPKFLNALAATNFMTVLDLDISQIEPIADLREGFDYGDENVVKATMKLETVWLREWRKAVMPSDVQKALAMVEGVEAGAGGGASPMPAPAGGRGLPAGPGGRGGGGPAVPGAPGGGRPGGPRGAG
jgi:hypothetical protein